MYKKIAYSTLIVLIATFTSLAQEKYSDKEIGFDREKTKQEFLKDGIGEKNIDKEIAEYRSLLVNIYRSNNEKSQARAPETSIGCGNIGFDDGLNEWCYIQGERPSPGVFNYGACQESFPDSQTQILDEPYNTTVGGISPAQLNLSAFGDHLIRLGNTGTQRRIDRVEKKIIITEANRLLTYRYAVVLQEKNTAGGHSSDRQPYFRVQLNDSNGNTVNCSNFSATAPGNECPSCALPGFQSVTSGTNILWYRPTSVQSIDLVGQGFNIGDEITIVAEVGDCTEGGHYGYAYFEGFCGGLDDAIIVNQDNETCVGEPVTFESVQEIFGTPTWNLYNADTNSLIQSFNVNEPSYIFDQAGNYRMDLVLNNPSNPSNVCDLVFSNTFSISDCECTECENCNSFTPNPGETYVVSAWVKENHSEQQMDYNSTSVRVIFLNDISSIGLPVSFTPSGDIIDGWQRIRGEFTIPTGTTNISLDLVNSSSQVQAYFDDVRVHPFNGNMKSFVYDQKTQQLMAELDENNYATFYEYDKEGGLIRVKKETKDGVYTIQETRSGNAKDN